MSEAKTTTLDEETIGTLSETRLAHLLQELGSRRGALRDELARLEDMIERLEVELANRGAGG